MLFTTLRKGEINMKKVYIDKMQEEFDANFESKKGKLYIVEGVDGAGKETQSKLLEKALKEKGHEVKLISFPNYKNPSSYMVTAYLNGDFGEEADDVNAYTASTFFAVDRFASYKQQWGEFYNNGGNIIADRYTTANMVHQTAKMKTDKEKYDFLEWLFDLEFNKYGLPIPDQVLFLDVPPAVSLKLRENRKNKITGNEKKDIHEKNPEYMQRSYEASVYVAEKYKWETIECCDKENLKSQEDIHDLIMQKIKI